MINIELIDHIGIRITDRDRALAFYKVLGFEILTEVDFDAVIVIKNAVDVELNLVVNGVDLTGGKNILMDVPDKHPGITHVALRVSSIVDAIATLKENDISITQGPVTFGKDGNVSVFIRDPDRNTIELRGRLQEEEEIEGLEFYDPNG